MARILGIDPGLRVTGWGLVESTGFSLSYIAHGIIKTNDKDSLAARLDCLFQGLREVCESHFPHEAAVEEVFVNMNPASTLKLGMARGVGLLAPASSGIEVYEYTANQVKKSVVGVGHADKSQVAMMVRTLLPKCGMVDKDGADALAVAICHAHHRGPR